VVGLVLPVRGCVVRYEDMYAAAVGSWVPVPVPVDEAVAGRLCTPAAVSDTGIEAVAVSICEAPPQMAARAARLAVERAELDPADVSLVVYADSHYSGHDAWVAATYVQRVAIGAHNPTLAVDVRQLSNGGLAALELAAAYLRGAPRAAAVVAAAERYSLPGYDRWRSEPGAFLGDGASALVLSREAGFARLCSVSSWTDPELEGARRGDDQFGIAPFSVHQPVDVGLRREEFIARLGLDNWARLTSNGRRSSIELALAEADSRLTDIDWFVLPNLGWQRLRLEYLEPFGIDPERTAWGPWGRRVGHLGAADQFANVEFLLLSGRLRPGQRCLLVGASADVSWSAAVLEVCDRPDWVPPYRANGGS
jgi:3-oxoacyl-[acyl-carrier-protein] synthase III